VEAVQIAAQWQLPYLDLDEISDEEILLHGLPQTMTEKHSVLLLTENRLAVNDLQPLERLQEVYFYLETLPFLVIVDRDKLHKKIAALLHHQERENLLFDEASIVQYVEKLFSDAINKKASDIHLETDANHLRIRFRIDGILYETGKLSKHLAPRIITHLKVMAQLDITEKRLPQDGKLRISLPHHPVIDCRLSTCPVIHEEKIVLRLLNTNTQPLAVDTLGFSASHQASFLAGIQKPHGMILVTGPTGSGKTITLYTALHLLNHPHINISSVEDPVEITLPGINQVQVNDKIDLTFSKILRAFLRQDPDIIMVGEMRDKETADIAIKASQTGHLVLSTLHTNSAAETLTRLINMGIPVYDIAGSLTLIIAQRLIRKLCPSCKTEDILSQTYTAAGCTKCEKGYRGRTGIYEFLPVTPAIAALILCRPEAAALEKQARAEGMTSLYEHGYEKAKMGITSLSEISRVTRC
jgi:type IV pilus assembly protein PilB